MYTRLSGPSYSKLTTLLLNDVLEGHGTIFQNALKLLDIIGIVLS